MTTQPLHLDTDRLLAIIELQNQIVAARLDMAAVMQVVVERAATLTRGTGGVIEMLEGESMVYQATWGTADGFLGLRLPRAGSLSGLCIEQGIALHASDTSTDSRVNREACRKLGAASTIVVPLVDADLRIGVLMVLSSRTNAFAEQDVETLRILARVVAAALNQAAECEAVRHASTHDPLTGIPNRRAFGARLTVECARYRRSGHAFSVAMLDLDGFKAANDRWGHARGDEVLIEVARILETTKREVDACFRLGGDEFAIILPDTDEDQASTAVARYVSHIDDAGLCEGTIRVSAGVASTANGDSTTLVERADAALYAVKRARKR